ncbi:MAG: hypothetical protein AAFR71_05825 [Pseudomonadota bacterium]
MTISVVCLVAVLLLTAEWRRIAASNGDLSGALAANPYNADTRRDLINGSLDIGQTDPAELAKVVDLAVDGIDIHPEDGRFDSALGAVELLKGQEAAARDHFSSAIKKTPDEALALRVQFVDAVNAGDNDAALNSLTRIVYRWSQTLGDLRPWILTFFDDRDLRTRAAAFFSEKPDLHPRIIAQLISEDAGHTAALDLITLLHLDYGMDVSAQAGTLISRMLNAGRYTDAILLDKTVFEPSRGSGGGFVNNGDFAQYPTRSPFDWRLPRINGLSIDQITAPDPAGLEELRLESGASESDSPRSLRLAFLNSPARLNVTSWQALVLPQGSYALDVIHKTGTNYSAPKPVSLEIRCRGSGTPKATVVLSPTSNKWTIQRSMFAIDPSSENCRTPFITFYSEPVAQSWRNQFAGHVDIGLVRLVRQQ